MAAALPGRAAGGSAVRLAELWRVLRPFRLSSLFVLGLVLADTALASLGVGIVLPVLQSLLDPEHRSALVSAWFPSFDALSAGARLLVLTSTTIAVFCLRAGVSLLAVLHSHRLLHRLRFYWVERIGVYYLRGPFHGVAARMQGELLNDWFNETLAAMRCCQAYLTYLASVVFVTALIALGFVVEWRTSVALIAVGAVVALVVRRTLYSRSSALSLEKLQSNQALSAGMVEDLANIREIKLMGAEGRRLDHLRALSARLGRVFIRSALIGEVPRIVAEPAAVALLMGMVLIGSLLLSLEPESMLPLVVFFSVAFYRLVTAASQMVGARIRALNEAASLRRVEAVVLKAEQTERLDVGLPIPSIDTDIAMRNLSFAYQAAGARAVHDVSAVFPKGKLTFLVGPSGAGKSTLLDLLLRLIEPAAGTIEVNGQDATAFRLLDWRRAFGYVSQHVSLFNGTIRMNLTLARPDATAEAMVEACRLAGADAFIRQFPAGYDTAVGDRGQSLSGGQRKRIAIARALMARPSVLILDEATTSFEHSLEQDMLRNLREALPSLTVIQVTHRLQSLEGADWVVGMDNGRVTACGPPQRVDQDVLAWTDRPLQD